MARIDVSFSSSDDDSGAGSTEEVADGGGGGMKRLSNIAIGRSASVVSKGPATLTQTHAASFLPPPPAASPRASAAAASSDTTSADAAVSASDDGPPPQAVDRPLDKASAPARVRRTTERTELGAAIKVLENESGQLELNLAHQALAELPGSTLETSPHAQVLRLSHNRLAALPSGLTRFAALCFIDVCHNDLLALPDLSSLAELCVLHASYNPRLGADLTNVCAMTSLTHLELDGVGLAAIPHALARLVRLRHLHLRENRLTQLDTGLFSLTALMDLALSANALEALPPAMGQLRALTALDLSANALTALPDELRGLSSLTELGLASNPLGGEWASLVELDAQTAAQRLIGRGAAAGEASCCESCNAHSDDSGSEPKPPAKQSACCAVL